MNKKLNLFGIISVLALIFIIAGCGDKAEETLIAPEISANASIQCDPSGPSVDPILVENWESGGGPAAECDQTDCESPYAYKVEPWDAVDEYGNLIDPSGAYYDAVSGNTITITAHLAGGEYKTFDWVSEYPVCAVIVKAGTKAYIYYYYGAYSDNGLYAPDNKGISHATFCFGEPSGGYALTVTKTAATEYTRTHIWTIDKEGDQTQLTLCEGEPGTVNYNVTVNSTEYNDSDWKVTGTITIANVAPEGMTAVDAVITSISDIAGGVDATVECDLPFTIPAGETVTCTYTADLSGAVDGTNTVTVTTSTEGVTGGTATADYTFGDPTLVQDQCITVSDDKFGSLGEVCLDAAPFTFEYSLEIEYEEYGLYEYTNTASFVTNDTGTEGSDSWTVYVRVCQCETAWGGNSEGGGRAWWFYYDASIGGEQTIWAGQHYDAGIVEYVGGNIIITLANGWELIDDDEAVKIQGYDVIPTKRPAAGKFEYKGTELIVPVGEYPYYAIHLDLRKCPAW